MSMTKPELLKYFGNFLGEELNRGQRHGEPSKNQYQDENTVRIHGYDIPVEKRKQRLLDALEAAGYLNEG